MDFIRQLLKEIDDGKKTFKPVSVSESDRKDFQSVAKVLVHANQQNWLDSFSFVKENWSGNHWYDLILVNSGLSYEGQLYLNNTPNISNENSATGNDIIEIKPNFMGIGVNVNELLRWWKNRKS